LLVDNDAMFAEGHQVNKWNGSSNSDGGIHLCSPGSDLSTSGGKRPLTLHHEPSLCVWNSLKPDCILCILFAHLMPLLHVK